MDGSQRRSDLRDPSLEGFWRRAQLGEGRCIPGREHRETRNRSETQRVELFLSAVEAFARAGYRLIGLDHFALQSDELAKAQDGGYLYRNFQGYTIRPAPDTIAFGMSSISDIGGAYVEFDLPEKAIPHRGIGPRQTARIPTDAPLSLESLRPQFVRIRFWQLWKWWKR